MFRLNLENPSVYRYPTNLITPKGHSAGREIYNIIVGIGVAARARCARAFTRNAVVLFCRYFGCYHPKCGSCLMLAWQ